MEKPLIESAKQVGEGRARVQREAVGRTVCSPRDPGSTMSRKQLDIGAEAQGKWLGRRLGYQWAHCPTYRVKVEVRAGPPAFQEYVEEQEPAENTGEE